MSVKESQFEDQKTKSFAENGMELLTAANTVSTIKFSGFIMGDTVPTIATLVVDENFIGGVYKDFNFSPGQYYPIGGSSMVISGSGSVLLIAR
jgi:hypothetical protein